MPIELEKVSSEAMYSVAEIAELLELSDQSIRLYLNNGKIKGVKGMNRRWRVPGSEALRFVRGATESRSKNEAAPGD